MYFVTSHLCIRLHLAAVCVFNFYILTFDSELFYTDDQIHCQSVGTRTRDLANHILLDRLFLVFVFFSEQLARRMRETLLIFLSNQFPLSLAAAALAALSPHP